MPKLPSFSFYPGDWLRNDVAGCSLEAQGLWLRMMMVMHDAEVYGELSINGEPMPDEFVAKKCGISRKIYQKYLKELSLFSVINRRNNGVIYSGRMVKDDEKRQQNAKRQRDFYDRHKDEPNAEPNAPSSSSSSISVSRDKKKKEVKPLSTEAADRPRTEVEQVFDFWKETMKKSGQTVLDKKRTYAIASRITEGFTLDFIKSAILGCSVNPHNRGINDRGTKFNDIELICRNASNLERFEGYYEDYMAGTTPTDKVIKFDAGHDDGKIDTSGNDQWCDICKDDVCLTDHRNDAVAA